jgi:hypothetical protein
MVKVETLATKMGLDCRKGWFDGVVIGGIGWKVFDATACLSVSTVWGSETAVFLTIAFNQFSYIVMVMNPSVVHHKDTPWSTGPGYGDIIGSCKILQ